VYQFNLKAILLLIYYGNNYDCQQKVITVKYDLFPWKNILPPVIVQQYFTEEICIFWSFYVVNVGTIY